MAKAKKTFKFKTDKKTSIVRVILVEIPEEEERRIKRAIVEDLFKKALLSR